MAYNYGGEIYDESDDRALMTGIARTEAVHEAQLRMTIPEISAYVLGWCSLIDNTVNEFQYQVGAMMNAQGYPLSRCWTDAQRRGWQESAAQYDGDSADECDAVTEFLEREAAYRNDRADAAERNRFLVATF